MADSAEHTIESCTAWLQERSTLQTELGIQNIFLGEILLIILDSKEAWSAFIKFAEEVITHKEEIEREKQAAQAPLNSNRSSTES